MRSWVGWDGTADRVSRCRKDLVEPPSRRTRRGPVDIHGAWAGGRDRFLQRYRSGMAETLGEEFEAPFARLDRMGPDRFDRQWMRHTGTWWRLHTKSTLAEALATLADDPILHPVG